MVCVATGVPEPSVMWKREDSKDIILRNEGRDKQGMKKKKNFLYIFMNKSDLIFNSG